MMSSCLCGEPSPTIITTHRELYLHVRVLEREEEQHFLKILLIGADMVKLYRNYMGIFCLICGFPGFAPYDYCIVREGRVGGGGGGVGRINGSGIVL